MCARPLHFRRIAQSEAPCVCCPIVAGGHSLALLEFPAWRDRCEAHLLDIAAPTQKQTHNLDWLLASMRTPLGQPEAVEVPGTDHVGVKATLAAVRANTLRTRVELPQRSWNKRAKTTGVRG